jgi:hypothetical protein
MALFRRVALSTYRKSLKGGVQLRAKETRRNRKRRRGFTVVGLLHNEFSKESWMSRESGGGRLLIYHTEVFGAYVGAARAYL